MCARGRPGGLSKKTRGRRRKKTLFETRLGSASNEPRPLQGTPCECVVRGLFLQASQQIEEMLSDSDPLLRYGGVFAVGLANYATGQVSSQEKEIIFLFLQRNEGDSPAFPERLDGWMAVCVCLSLCVFLQKDAIRLLLHFAVADVSDDVRRGSVMALGFVLAAQRGEVGFLKGRRRKSAGLASSRE